MRRNGIVLAVFALMLVTVLSSGCTGNTTETSPPLTTAAPGAVALHQQGFEAYSNGNYTAAIDLYNQAIAADPSYTRIWMDKGHALMALNRSEEAIAVYDVVLARDTNVPIVWNNRGKALMATGNYSAARDSFNQAIQLAPEFAEAKENRDLAQKKLQEGSK